MIAKPKIIILVMFCLLTLGCSSDDYSTNPINLLPEATQTGENTFGCLLDGEAFIPGGGTNPLDCVYQFVDGEYFFGLQGNNRDGENNGRLINLSTNSLEIKNNQTYILSKNIPSNAYGSYAFNSIFSTTNNNQTGELTITYLNVDQQIVSGTFWFDIEHPITGEIIQIRDGRFDMEFSL